MMKNPSKIFAALLLSSALFSCSSGHDIVRPTLQADTQPSFDGDTQDSGLIEISNGIALVSSRFVDRYNAMVLSYGAEAEFMPPLQASDGVTPASAQQCARHPTRGPLFLMTPQALVNFIKMNQWRKMGRVPSAKAPKPGVTSRIINAIIS